MAKTYFRTSQSFHNPISPKLVHLDIELSERCNNNCIHCYINQPQEQGEIKKNEMSSSQIKDYLQQAADLGCMRVRFTGGEPLLRSDFEELFSYACRLGMKVILFTNARLITNNLISLFLKYSNLLRTEVTIYGMHKQSYEAVTRTPGSFDEFWQGLQLLLSNNIQCDVKYSVLNKNKLEIPEFESWIKYVPLLHGEPNYNLFFSLRTRRDDENRNKLINKLRLDPNEGVQILSRDKEKYQQSLQLFAEKYLGSHGNRIFSCGAGSSVCIDSYGVIQPCMGFRHPSYMFNGNDISAALAFYQNLKLITTENQNYLERCGKCFLHGLCEQCPSKSWEETGTPDTPVEYFCQIAHAQARYLGWIGQTENGWDVKDWRNRISGS